MKRPRKISLITLDALEERVLLSRGVLPRPEIVTAATVHPRQGANWPISHTASVVAQVHLLFHQLQKDLIQGGVAIQELSGA